MSADRLGLDDHPQTTDGPAGRHARCRPAGRPSDSDANELGLGGGLGRAFLALPYVPWNFLLNLSTRPAASTNFTEPV